MKERVIYIRSFSKTLLPGLRLGMAIIPEPLKKEFILYKQSMDINTPVLTQGALEIYLKSHMYKSHVIKTKKFYKNKMEVLKEACGLFFPKGVKYHIPPTGIYAFIETGKGSAEKIVRSLKECKIRVNSIKDCYLEGFSASEGIRLCVCSCRDEELVRAVKLMGNEMKRGYQYGNNG